MNTMPSPTSVASTGNYQATRFNALQHGVLSRYAVLPWEDRSEYQALLDALVSEHAPNGPTEEHLVEELAGIIWRKRRLRISEAALYREELRRDVTGYTTPEHLAVAALLPLTGTTNCKANIPQALTTNTRDTARDLRDVKRDQAMTRKAWEILAEDGPNAYTHALASLREDTRTCWLECLDDPPSDGCEYVPAAESLKAWIDRRWDEWFEEPIAELEHREAIREQAFGSAYGTNRLETSVRYEVHLDRKLERTLTMLIRLRDLRCTAEPA